MAAVLCLRQECEMTHMKATDIDDFLKTILSYGLIVRGNVESIEELKKAVANIDGLKIVYQRVSGSNLFIKEKGE